MGFLYEQSAISATQALAELANKGLATDPLNTWRLEQDALVRSTRQQTGTGLLHTSEELRVNFNTLRFSYTAIAKAIPRVRLREAFGGILLDDPRFVISDADVSLEQRVQVVGDDASVTAYANNLHHATNNPNVASLFGWMVARIVSDHATTRPNPVEVISLIQRNHLFLTTAELPATPRAAEAKMCVLPLVH